MRRYIVASLAFCMVFMVEAKELDYKRIFMLGTGKVGGALTRYLISLDEYCIVVQGLIPGGRGNVSTESRICSLDGKNFNDGYADVSFKKGVFKNDRLFFEVSVTPKVRMGEEVKNCEVIFRNGLADHLSCKDKGGVDVDCIKDE